MASINDAFNPNRNALNLIRLILACLVIVSHAPLVGGFGREPRIGDITLGVLAVGCFFVISGYLITKSRSAMGFAPYMWRRALRVLPGYFVCLLVTGVALTAIAGTVRGGWTLDASLHYVLTNAVMLNADPTVGLTLDGAPLSEVLNASLWTLRYEIGCYVLVGVAYSLGVFRRERWTFLAAYVLTTLLALVVINVRGDDAGLIGQITLLVPFFVAGAMLFRYAERIPFNWQLAVSSLVLVIALCLSGFGRTLTALPLAYLMIWLGTVAPDWMQNLGSKNDYSYGMYLYGMPVQQVLVVFGIEPVGAIIYTAASLAVTFPFAAGSWFIVERNAMHLRGLVRVHSNHSHTRGPEVTSASPSRPNATPIS